MQKTIDELREEYAIDRSYDDAAIAAFIECYSAEDLANFEDSYSGHWNSAEEFAQDMADGIGVEIGTQWPMYCIDWEYAARELMYDYSEHDGYYFRAF